MFDPKTTERIPAQQWLNSHLSIARFAGGCRINGTQYWIDPVTGDLVRADVLKAHQKNVHKPVRT